MVYFSSLPDDTRKHLYFKRLNPTIGFSLSEGNNQ
jgi:hypothetical protein